MGDAWSSRVHDARRKAPQALAKAEAALERANMKIRGLAIPAVDAIERLLQAESEALL
jgi:hypothetical protein